METKNFFIAELLRIKKAMSSPMWRSMSLSVLFVFACMLGACSDDDEKELVKEPEPETPVDPDDPNGPDDPDTPQRDGTALFLDAAKSSGISLTELAGETNGYQLSIQTTDGSKYYIPTVGLKDALANKKVKLTFEYKCTEDIAQFNIGYSGEENMNYFGKIEADVDKDEDGWAPYSVSLVQDIEKYRWGNVDDWLGFYLQPATKTGAPVTFELRNIYLEKTDEQVEPIEPEDPNKYPLSFSSNRPSTAFENKFGRADGIEYTRNGDEYHITFVDRHYDATQSHNEHMFATDPLTKMLNVGDNQKVELVFKYKASTQYPWQFTTFFQVNEELAIFNATVVDCQNMKASANANPDSEGWATYRHDLTSMVKLYKWGQDLSVSPQIRLRFRLMRSAEITDPAHPEKYDFKEIDLKDVHLQVGDMPAPIEPEDPNVLALIFSESSTKANVTIDKIEDGQYTLSFAAGGGHGEHFIETDVLAQALTVADNQKIELVFDYKPIGKIEYPWQFTAYLRGGGIADNGNTIDMQPIEYKGDWGNIRMDITDVLKAKQWGLSVSTYKIRFRFRLVRQNGVVDNPQCPEMYGFNGIELKNVKLEIKDK